MSKGGITKEERYLLALYEMVKDLEDPEEPVDSYTVGLSVGITIRQVDAITTQLIRTNFIRRSDKHWISLTPNGLDLINSLLNS